MDKFEYIAYDLDEQTYGEYRNPDAVWKPASLSELGEKGWEIVMPIISGHGNAHGSCIDTNICILKRKIEDSSRSISTSIDSISGEDAARALTRAAYTGALMAFDLLEKQNRLPGQVKSAQPKSSEYEYNR